MGKKLEEEWRECVKNAKKKGYACKNCNNRVKNGDDNPYARICKFMGSEVPIDGFCERYQSEPPND